MPNTSSICRSILFIVWFIYSNFPRVGQSSTNLFALFKLSVILMSSRLVFILLSNRLESSNLGLKLCAQILKARHYFSPLLSSSITGSKITFTIACSLESWLAKVQRTLPVNSSPVSFSSFPTCS